MFISDSIPYRQIRHNCNACSSQRIESRSKLADDKGGLKCCRLMYVVGHFAISPNDRVRELHIAREYPTSMSRIWIGILLHV